MQNSNSNIDDFIAHLKRENGMNITDVLRVPGKFPEYSDVYLLPQVSLCLEKMGITRLYSHQVKAIEATRAKKDIVLAVGTAGGKSLSYAIPIAEIVKKGGSAIYIAPTNALINDQCANLKKFILSVVPDAIIEKYNGAVDDHDRAALRKKRISVLLTNPEMIHLSLLMYHRKWSDFLRRLELIVVDESHYWRGVPGSHVANIFRRLIRICDHYGAHPKFFCCSATIGNPVEHASALTGRTVELVTGDSAGRSEKTYVLYNPYRGHIDLSDGNDRNPHGSGADAESLNIFKNLLLQGFTPILFSRTRSSVERIALQVVDIVGGKYPIAAYRGGLLPEERIKIEAALKSGALRGVITTNALELGIDIGSLNACVIDGFPGSIMSFYQQAGRVGRAGGHSIVILVAGANPIDQYYAEHPDHFFSSGSENATISYRTPGILAGHLICAEHELPARAANLEVFGRLSDNDMRNMVELSARIKKNPYFHYKSINIRGGGENYTMITNGGKEIVEANISPEYARREAFQGAVIVHGGNHYIVHSVDDEKHIILCERTGAEYHTKTIMRRGISMKSILAEKKFEDFEIFVGRGIVYDQVLGYKKIYYDFRDDSKTHPLKSSISRSVSTTIFGLKLLSGIKSRIVNNHLDYQGGLHGLEHIIANVSTRRMLVEATDLGSCCEADTVYLYDCQAGMGAAEKVYVTIKEVIREGNEIIETCACRSTTGCPLCVQKLNCERGNSPLNKMFTQAIMAKVMKGIEI